MKLVIVATNLNREKLWKRWQYLRDKFEDINITILAPKLYEDGTQKGYTFGRKEVFKGREYKGERFSLRTLEVKQDRFGGWSSKDLMPIITEEKPDCVYYIGVHASRSLWQVIRAARKVHSKVYVFTMRGDLKKATYLSFKHRLIRMYSDFLTTRNVRRSDAIFVHYPDAVTAFRNEGYKGPLYINTQIGVDTAYFKFTQEGRDKIRQQLGLDGCYVFGSASRLNAEKGILDTIEALPVSSKVKYMILGGGTQEDSTAIRACAEKRGVLEQIVLPGLISWDELPDYLSAMDCAMHVPKRTTNWVETFSLALVQAMSVELPVIGSRSGSVPYQIGLEELLVDESNPQQIHEKMLWVMGNREQAKRIGMAMRQRCIQCFDVEHIAECFGIVLHELAQGVYNPAHLDTATKWDT